LGPTKALPAADNRTNCWTGFWTASGCGKGSRETRRPGYRARSESSPSGSRLWQAFPPGRCRRFALSLVEILAHKSCPPLSLLLQAGFCTIQQCCPIRRNPWQRTDFHLGRRFKRTANAAIQRA